MRRRDAHNQPTWLDERIDKEDKEAEDQLLFYDERRLEYQEMTVGIAFFGSSGAAPATGVTVQATGAAGHSDPTGDKGSFLAGDKAHRASKWLEVIELVESGLTPRDLAFLKARRTYRFLTARDGFIHPVQADMIRQLEKLGYEVSPDGWDRTSLTIWWNGIVARTARVAAEHGLFKKEKD